MLQTRVVKRKNAQFAINNFFFKYHVFYEITWKNIVEWGRSQMTKWLIRIACWIKSLQKHTQNM